MKSGGNQVSTQTSSPWGPAVPGLGRVIDEAGALYDRGGIRYPDFPTFTGPSQYTQGAIQAYGQPSPLLTAGQEQIGSTIAGDYLTNNPYLDQVYNRAARGVTDQFLRATVPGTNATFSQAGRYGSNAHRDAVMANQDALGRTLGEMATDLYGQNYATERQNQLRAAQLTPGLAYTGADRMARAGQMQEAYDQAALQDRIARFEASQMQPYDALTRYMGYLSGTGGGIQQTSQPLTRNVGAGVLGGALGGASLGQMMGGSYTPYLAGAGALLGGFF